MTHTTRWRYWLLPPSEAPTGREAFLRSLEIETAGRHCRLPISVLGRRAYVDRDITLMLEPGRGFTP